MKATVTLDDDVALLIQQIMRERDASFGQVLNEGLRKGLSPRARGPRTRFVPMCSDMGPLLVRTGSLNALADELEDQHVLAKLTLPR
ncbi:MAG TPA: hypothetical protein PKO45_07625 [Rubrivivax sp.]|nr:hypothetical protein [Burkholderiales bacterium]HNT38975.1 hypothetical protein [Rubrivivax sp.]